MVGKTALTINNNFKETKEIGWADRFSFMYLSLGLISVGALSSIIFWALVNPHFKIFNIIDMLNKEKVSVRKVKQPLPLPNRTKWFYDVRFYMIILINCSTRLVFNLIATYTPYYVQMSTTVEKRFVTLIPLVQFISGFVISFAMEISAAKLTKIVVFIIGGVLCITGGLVLGFIEAASFDVLIPIAIIIGFGTSITVIQTYAMAAEVFGQDEQTSGFCFGIMGIVEKFTNGGVVIAIQGLAEKLLVDETVTQSDFYRFVFRYGVVGFGVLCIIGALGLKLSLYYRPIMKPRGTDVNET